LADIFSISRQKHLQQAAATQRLFFISFAFLFFQFKNKLNNNSCGQAAAKRVGWIFSQKSTCPLLINVARD